jgi:hypothetical protein
MPREKVRAGAPGARTAGPFGAGFAAFAHERSQVMRSVRSPLLTLLLLLPLTCGGGDGGTSMMTITDANAIQVASNVTGAMQFVGNFEEILESLVSIIEEAGGSGTCPCPGGGTATAVINDVAPVDEISAGDSVSLTFSGCTIDMDGDPVALDGSVGFTVTASTDVPGGYDVTVRFVYTNLALAMGTETITLNGDITAHSSTPDQLLFTTIASGDSLRAAISGPGGSMSARISDMDETRIVDANLGTFVVRAAGTLYHSDLDGSVDYETTRTSPEPGTGLRARAPCWRPAPAPRACASWR